MDSGVSDDEAGPATPALSTAFAHVAVGDEEAVEWNANVLGMDQADILLGLRNHPLFMTRLVGVEELDAYRVRVTTLPPAAALGGSEGEKELEGAMRVGELGHRNVTNKDGEACVHLRVALPPAPAPAPAAAAAPPPAASAAAGAAGLTGPVTTTGTGTKPSVTIRDVGVTVRDLEAKHKLATIAVLGSWDALLHNLRAVGMWADGTRLYYTSRLGERAQMQLSEEGFVAYCDELFITGSLRDIWVLRAAAPGRRFTGDSDDYCRGFSGGGYTTSESDFRRALLLRDASDTADAGCALCGAVDDVQAAAIVPQQFPTAAERERAMADAELFSLDDLANGFLLCDQCHDCFAAYLWSVNDAGRVVLSHALTTHFPRLAGFAGKVLFPDGVDVSAAVRRARPIRSVWAWHFRAYEKATAARHGGVGLTLSACTRCDRRFVAEWRQDRHEATCTGAAVHDYTTSDGSESDESDDASGSSQHCWRRTWRLV